VADREYARDEAGKFAEEGGAGHVSAKEHAAASSPHEGKAQGHKAAAEARRAAAAKEADPVRRSEHLARASHHDARAAVHEAKAEVDKEAEQHKEQAGHGTAAMAEKHSGEKVHEGHDEHAGHEGAHGEHEHGKEHGGIAGWVGKKLEGAKELVEHAGEKVGRVEEQALEEGGLGKAALTAYKTAASAGAGALGGVASKLGGEEHEGHGHE
jgi:hypothetical protein